ncbi:MAG TPA: hypothetical protein DCX23_01170 [Lachnospiraceae bacterium]|nr:hypothetical protein [Lachnospiraceae bacterium]
MNDRFIVIYGAAEMRQLRAVFTVECPTAFCPYFFSGSSGSIGGSSFRLFQQKKAEHIFA